MYRNSNIRKAEWSVCPFTIVTLVSYQVLGILCDKDPSLALKRGKRSIIDCWLLFHLRDKHHTHNSHKKKKKRFTKDNISKINAISTNYGHLCGENSGQWKKIKL